MVNVEGTTYLIYKLDTLPTTLAFFFAIFAVVFLILTISQVKAQKNIAKRNLALEGLCSEIGGNSTVITATISDKSESKKAAAKTAGWMFGAILSTIFTGAGVYRVYSGSNLGQFILGENSLYAIHGMNMQELEKITAESFPAESVTVKKRKITLKCADGKRSITFMPDKKCPLTVEEIEKNLNDIFFNAPSMQPAPDGGVAENEVAVTENDPFDEFSAQDTPVATDGDAPVESADGDTPEKD